MDQKGKHKNLNKSKLVRLLSQMESSEIKQFKAQLKVKGTKLSDARSVLLYLCALHPTYPPEPLNYMAVYKAVFPTQPFNYQRLMKVVSHAHSELKQFLVSEMLQKDDFLSDYLLAKVYAEKNLTHDLSLLLNKQQLTSTPSNTLQQFFEQWQWHQLQFYSDQTTNLHRAADRLPKAMAALDWHYLGTKVKYACEVATQEKLMDRPANIPFSTAIHAYCLTNFEQLPIFHRFYFIAWQLIQHQKEVDFIELKKLFFASVNELTKEDRLILLTYLLNFSFYKVRENNAPFIQEAYDLYQFGIDKDLLIIDKLFVDDHFINLVSICSALKKVDWIESVISSKLAPIVDQLSPTVYNIAMARLSFAKDDFLACRMYLMEVDHTIFVHSFRARIYQVACAYELKELKHIVESHCKAYENYLRRHIKDHEQMVHGGLNFISMVRQLNKFNPKKKQLQELLTNHQPILFQKWLQEKIEALK